jgi:dihydroorotase-like cyclic amidohydrolase
VADTAGVVEQVWRLGRESNLVDVQPIGAVTLGLAGERLAELGAMAESAARVRIFSDDGHCVSDPRLMRRALEYVKAFDGVIAQHAEEPRLTEGAQMHEGVVSARLGPARLAGRREEADHRPGRTAGRARRRAAARVPRLHRRQRGDPALGQASRHPVTAGGDPAPPAAHRRGGPATTTRCSR